MLKHKRMEHIEPYFGSKNKKQKKTDQLKVINGSAQASMWVTGATTAKKVSAFNTTKMEINMRACGHLINVTDRALTGAWKTKS